VNAAILAASNGQAFLLLLGPAAGGGLYYGLWSFYRNASKSHSFETETRVAAQPITGTENKVDEVRGTTASGISGDNVSNHRQRVQRVS
jgi:hypothetical protein